MLDLTYQSDTLNGLLGIFRAFQELPVPAYHYWGVPILFQTEAEAPESITARFLRGLTWRLSKPSPRRIGFPSWSWAGWSGHVEWPGYKFFADDAIALHAIRGEGEPMRLEDMVE